ncbi:hypothetical protein UT300012_02280 [Paraclostridium bifermentans]
MSSLFLDSIKFNKIPNTIKTPKILAKFKKLSINVLKIIILLPHFILSKFYYHILS